MRFSRLLPLVVVCAAFLGTVLSCSSPSSASSGSSGEGGGAAGPASSLVLSFSNVINSRTLAPSLSMSVVSYTVIGQGPSGASFTQSGVTGTSFTAPNLAVGTWSLTVNAYNSDPTLIGRGLATAVVSASSSTPVTISVGPIAGSGTLDLTLQWVSGGVATPNVVATLSPAIGAALTPWIAGSASGMDTRTYTNSSVATGYSVLSLQLWDGPTTNGLLAASTTDVVRIVDGQTTSGVYTATLNSAGGSLAGTINSNMQNPLNVFVTGSVTGSISSNGAPTAASQTFTVSSTGNTSGGSVSYTWYLNGALVGSRTTTYAYTAAIPSGYTSPYRDNIAAVAVTTDGTQAGVLNFYEVN